MTVHAWASWGDRLADGQRALPRLASGEGWSWSYVDDVARFDGIKGRIRIPPSPLLR